MRDFIGYHRDTFGVEPVYRVLHVAPSPYVRHAALLRESHKRCARALREKRLAAKIQRGWRPTCRYVVPTAYGGNLLARA